MTSLAEIRAKLQQQENNSNQGPSGPNPIYPFWNIKEGESATIRFLPDADPNNAKVIAWIGTLGNQQIPIALRVTSCHIK